MFLGAIGAADLDRSLGLHHRSAITHNALIPLLLLVVLQWYLRKLRQNGASSLVGVCRCLWLPNSKVCRVVAALLMMGLAIHLAADCVPAGWRGTALVYFPYPSGAKSYGFGFSVLWLAANGALAFATCHWVLSADGPVMRWLGQAAAIILLVGYAGLKEAHPHLAIQKVLVGLALAASGYGLYRLATRVLPTSKLPGESQASCNAS